MNLLLWQVISNISLALGIILMIVAIVLALRYKIFSIIISDSSKKDDSEHSADTVTPIILDIPDNNLNIESGTADTDDSGVPDNSDVYDENGASDENDIPDDNATMVVKKKKPKVTADKAAIRSVTEEKKKEDFFITRNILVISADPDVVDR